VRDLTKIKGWLYSILYREFLNLRRRTARTTPLEETPEREPAPQPAPQARTLDGRRAVAALHSLDEPYRAVLSLYYLEDLSQREIAEALELPIGTAMSRLSRAKDALRGEVEIRMTHGFCVGAGERVGHGGRAAAYAELRRRKRAQSGGRLAMPITATLRRALARW
jgi:DNA-directed RNA polymerase specialized sigma24 family protein